MNKVVCVMRYPKDISLSYTGGDYEFDSILLEEEGRWFKYEWTSAWGEFPWCWIRGDFNECDEGCSSECRWADAFYVKDEQRYRPLRRITKEEAENIKAQAIEVIEKEIDELNTYIELKIKIEKKDLQQILKDCRRARKGYVVSIWKLMDIPPEEWRWDRPLLKLKRLTNAQGKLETQEVYIVYHKISPFKSYEEILNEIEEMLNVYIAYIVD